MWVEPPRGPRGGSGGKGHGREVETPGDYAALVELERRGFRFHADGRRNVSLDDLRRALGLPYCE